jgi:sec-independent protein translocase protein TatC
MAQLHEDDLFRHSSMSFGEHLEELRSRLFRAALWLLFGVIIGFIVGQPVVLLIQAPMERALKDFYENKSRAELEARNGAELAPCDQQLSDEGYISEQAYVEPERVLQELSKTFPGLAKPSAAAATPCDPHLLPLTIWRLSKNDPRLKLRSFSAMEPFMIYLKVAMLTGAILASPLIFREIWLFVAAGLYPHERRYIHIFLPFSIGLFLAGVAMAFFVALPVVLRFLLGFNSYLDIDPQQRLEEYLSFVLFLPLAFGIGFQLPLVMLFVNRIGLVSVETYRKQWRIAILVIFIIAMILTPSPDIGSMSLLAVPMTLLYFGGIALCAYTSGRRPAGLGRE